SPRPIAASHVLHRLLVPRHPPSALSNLTTKMLASTMQLSTNTTTPHHPHTTSTTPKPPPTSGNPQDPGLMPPWAARKNTTPRTRRDLHHHGLMWPVFSGPNRMPHTHHHHPRPRSPPPPRQPPPDPHQH